MERTQVICPDGDAGYIDRIYYKPLMPDDHSFLGIVVENEDGSKVKTPEDGKWRGQLHTYAKSLGYATFADYKLEHQIPMSDGWIASQLREQSIRHGNKLRQQGKLRNPPPKKQGTTNHIRRHTVGTQSKRNMCPLQLPYRYNQLAKQLGKKTLSQTDFRQVGDAGFVGSVIFRYGSWNAFLEAMGKPINFSRWKDADIIIELVRFAQIHKRPPYHSDFQKHLLPFSVVTVYDHFGSFVELKNRLGLIDSKN